VEQDAPFIVDWDAKQMASLTDALRSPNGGAVVVARQHDAIRVLTDCKLSGTYAPSTIGMYRGLLQVRPGDSAMPRSVARPDALQQISTAPNGGDRETVDYRFVVAGRHHLGSSRTSAGVLELAERTSDGCRGATHFVRAALNGAFEREGDPRVAAAGAGAKGGQSGAPAHGGDFTQCLLAGNATSAACSAFVKIELVALSPARVSFQVVQLSLRDPAAGAQLRFRSKDQIVAETQPSVTAGAVGQVLPPVDVADDPPLLVEVVMPVRGRNEVVASGKITPADVRRAVFQVQLYGSTTGTVQLAASQAAATP
jgi:hypothetical protein